MPRLRELVRRVAERPGALRVDFRTVDGRRLLVLLRRAVLARLVLRALLVVRDFDFVVARLAMGDLLGQWESSGGCIFLLLHN